MKTITPIVGLYSKSKSRLDTYDLIEPEAFPFPYFIISSPKSKYLIEKNVHAVMDCWKAKRKILHTGLIECYEDWYYGDNLNNKGKKELIIVHSFDKTDRVSIYLFKSFYPKKPLEFSKNFVLME